MQEDYHIPGNGFLPSLQLVISLLIFRGYSITGAQD
jgi:hypothetical protein